MMLGVFLHAGLAYANPAQSVWLATDPGSSRIIDAAIWFIHLFRMALFFSISGYFAKWMIERKGIRAFLWNRTVRIVFPFVAFYPFLLAAMTACIALGLTFVKQPQGLMGVISEAAKNGPQDVQAQPLTTMHLWFLYYLALFSLVAAVLTRLPAIRWPWFIGTPWLIRRPWLMAIAPLILVPGTLAAGVPMSAPESFVPHWWPFCFYGIFFASGWWLHGREANLDKLDNYAVPLSITSIIMFVIYYRLMPVLDIQQLVPLQKQEWIAEGILTSYLSMLLVLLALLIGRRKLNWPSSVLRFISDSSYWVYLIHLPIVILIQTVLIEVSINVWLKLGITIFCTLLACLLTYVVFVRYTPVGWMLNGKRKFP